MGIGYYTAEDRAAMAARFRDKLSDMLPESMKQYLHSWEVAHGPVRYQMQVVGVNEGYFVKENKGKELWGARLIENSERRKDIYG